MARKKEVSPEPKKVKPPRVRKPKQAQAVEPISEPVQAPIILPPEPTLKGNTQMTTMTDGREVDFGKKTVIAETTNTETGVSISLAFSDGQYRTLSIDALPALIAYASKAVKVAVSGLESSATFDQAQAALLAGEAFRKPRAIDPAAHLSPVGKALVELTGKSPEEITTWLAGKTKIQIHALRRDPKIAPILLRQREEEEAAKAARAAAAGKTVETPVDLLSDLLDETTPA